MALDRFVSFATDTPSVQSVEEVLRNFLGSVGKVEKTPHTELEHWFLSLPGDLSSALKSEGIDRFSSDRRGRWIEVFYHPGEVVKIDVLTRQMDDFTNAIADGIVSCLMRRWDGKLEV